MKITDTHCHLNDPSFENKLDEVLERAERSGVGNFIVPCYDIPSLERTARLSVKYKNIYPAYGIHPWYIDEKYDSISLRDFIVNGNTVAIGEIGLDYAEDITIPREIQRRYFINQIELAVSFNLPVLVHCRRAHQDMLDILSRYRGRIKGIMHSYSGSKEMMYEFLSLGLYISFSGAVTRSHAKKYHENAIAIPQERILFETDAPSISIQNVQAQDVEPCHITEIIKFVADLRETDYDTMVGASINNVKSLFGDKIGRE